MLGRGQAPQESLCLHFVHARMLNLGSSSSWPFGQVAVHGQTKATALILLIILLYHGHCLSVCCLWSLSLVALALVGASM